MVKSSPWLNVPSAFKVHAETLFGFSLPFQICIKGQQRIIVAFTFKQCSLFFSNGFYHCALIQKVETINTGR